MRVTNDQYQNIMILPKENSEPSQPETPQIQNIMVRPENQPAGVDGRASVRNAEGSIGAGLIADQLKGELNQLKNILSKLLEYMASPSQSSGGLGSIKNESLLERAKSALDPDDSGIKGAAGPSNAAGSTPHLVNNGGKVLSNPVISNIYVGNYFNTTQGKADVAHNNAAAKDWVTNGNEAILSEYGVGKASFNGSDVVAGASPSTFTDADVQNLVKQEIAAGRTPAGSQVVHTIILPPGTVLSDGNVNSTQGLGGYHGSYHDPATGKPVYYAAIVYGQGSNGIDFNGNPQDNISIVESHEWSEAATDPDVADVNRGAPVQGTLTWYDNQYGEIGDIAINISNDPNLADVWGKVDGFAFQNEWSNKQNKELLSVPTSTPPPPPKFTAPPDNLRRGDRGAEVSQLQQDLVHLGFNPGPIDGIFGPLTQAGVQAFQRANGLKADGIYGPLTRAALTKALSNA